MRVCKATLKSITPMSQSKHIQEPKLKKEQHDDYEKRTWRFRLNTDDNGNVVIPPMMFKNCVAEAAKYLSIPIPGKGKSTYTKHFEAGVLVLEPLPLNVHRDDVPGEWFHVPSDGKRGGASRVMKCFPVIKTWTGDVVFHIFDETITPEVFEQVLKEAGMFIGVGRFRPRNNGFYGRFDVVKTEWTNA